MADIKGTINPHGTATAEWMVGQGWRPDTDSLVPPDLCPHRLGDVVAWLTRPNGYQWWFGLVRDGALYRITGLIATNRGAVDWVILAMMHMKVRVG